MIMIILDKESIYEIFLLKLFKIFIIIKQSALKNF